MAKFSVHGTFDDNKGNHIDLGLILLAFEENNIHFIYSPAFDLTGYGKSEKEAHESFQIALSEFLRYAVNKKTLFNELERLGWKIKKSKKITSAPSLEELLTSNDYLAEILNEKDYKQIKETVQLPAYA